MEVKKTIPVYDIAGSPEVSQGLFKFYQLKGDKPLNPPLACVPFQTNIPHRHSFYEICVFLEGQGDHEIDFIHFPIQATAIHFIFPGQVHHLINQKDVQGYVLAFDRDFYTFGYDPGLLTDLAYVSQKNGVFMLNLSGDDFSEFLDILNLIKKEYMRNSLIASDILRALLHMLLLKSKYHYQHNFLANHSHPKAQRILASFHQNLEKNFCRMHLVKEYAEELALSTLQLNKIAKEITGKTAGELINERLILEAKRYLNFSQMNHKQIAYALGFEDPSYFSRFFRKRTGFSPSEFKKKSSFS